MRSPDVSFSASESGSTTFYDLFETIENAACLSKDIRDQLWNAVDAAKKSGDGRLRERRLNDVAPASVVHLVHQSILVHSADIKTQITELHIFEPPVDDVDASEEDLPDILPLPPKVLQIPLWIHRG